MALTQGGASITSIELDTKDMVKVVSVKSSLFDTAIQEVVFAPIKEGSTFKTLEVKLRRNALVRGFDVVVTAARAAEVAAGVAGQIRTASKSGGTTSIVVDFGALRTVSGISLPSGLAAQNVNAWIGTKFQTATFFDPPKQFGALPSEIRTERIEVVVTGPVNASQLATGMYFLMPDLPSGIELRIDDGPPVFTNPAPVQPGTDAALNDTDWNKDARRIVHLAGALSALTGDATRDEEATFKLKLTSNAPGFLDLKEHSRDLRYVRRASFDGAADKDVEFETEGQTVLRLDSLPTGLAVNEVRFNVTALVPGTRVLPAVGPDASGVAEIRVTPDRAMIVRLDPLTPLGQLTGVRLPLRAGSSGAEARVVFWNNKQDASQPVDALPVGASQPQTLAASDAAQWTTFTWAQPVTVPLAGLWAALTVNRGEVYFEFAANDATTSQAVVLWGAPSGPWRNLPAALAAQRGRIRLMGTPKKGTTIDPYRLSVGAGMGQGITPNPKGVAGVAALAHPVTQSGRPELTITSFVAARLKLRDVEVVSGN
ncbi:MAG: hypothetical protein NTW28_05495 [Candidatus Solibacter sp.]|nr:hypothetical protein [Candidatus Solibacter sp.]